MVVASPPQPLAKNGVTVHEMRTIHMESCRKIFIPRDYSQGLNVHFETQFPMAFRGKISETTWDSTIRTINSIFAEAEKVCFATVLETLLGFVTCYCSRLISDTIYQKKMNMLSEYIEQENQQTYNPGWISHYQSNAARSTHGRNMDSKRGSVGPQHHYTDSCGSTGRL